MKNDFYTYAYLREDGTPYYVGKGRGKRAFCDGGRRCKKPPRDRIIFLKKNLTEEEAFKHEVYMIAVLGRKDLGTGLLLNFTDGGDGASNPAQEVRQKLSVAKIGTTHSNETRQKMSQSHKGKVKTEEHRRNLSLAHLGKKMSPEARQKMSLAKLGTKHSNETKQKMSESQRKRKM